VPVTIYIVVVKAVVTKYVSSQLQTFVLLFFSTDVFRKKAVTRD